jgi:hypothetical protein
MSRYPGPETNDPYSMLPPPRTPGSLGRNDAADPNIIALLGDTPGPLGVHDGAGKLASGGRNADANSGRGSWVRADLRGLQPISQSLSTLCWLTCYQMLYIWKGLDPDTIEAKLRGAGLDYGAACKRGLLPGEMQNAARALGLRPFGVGGSISTSDLKQLLAFSPIWVTGEWFQNGLHTRLVIGASDDWVEYFDPWYGGTYGMDLQHKDMIDVFVSGNRTTAQGTNAHALIGKLNMSYWRS